MCHLWACPPPVSLAALGGGFGLGSARVGRRGGGAFFKFCQITIFLKYVSYSMTSVHFLCLFILRLQKTVYFFYLATLFPYFLLDCV